MELPIKNNRLPLLILVMVILAAFLFLQITDFNRKKMGYIDNQKVFDAFMGKKELALKLQQVRENHQNQIDSLKKVLEITHGQEAYKILENKTLFFQDLEEELRERYTADIWKQINASINDFGKQERFEFIYGATGDGSIMYADKANDISEEVILYINKKYKGE